MAILAVHTEAHISFLRILRVWELRCEIFNRRSVIRHNPAPELTSLSWVGEMELCGEVWSVVTCEGVCVKGGWMHCV